MVSIPDSFVDTVCPNVDFFKSQRQSPVGFGSVRKQPHRAGRWGRTDIQG